MYVDEEKTGNYPESVTLNGITYKVRENPDLLKFLQDVSKVEKNKLYSKFESLKANINELKNTQIVTPQVDREELVDSMKGSFVTKEDLETNLRSIVKEVVQPIVSQHELSRQEELKAYRDKLIAENEASCIPELVKGNTKEELDEAMRESIAIRQRYPSPVIGNDEFYGKPEKRPVETDTVMRQYAQDPQFAPNAEWTAQRQPTYQNPYAGQMPPQNVQQVPQMPQMPDVPRRDSGDYNNPRMDIRKMTSEQFARSKDQIEAELRAIYG